MLIRFFTRYMQQLQETDQAEKATDGQLGVINYIRTRSIDQKIRPEDLAKLAHEEGAELMIKNFFSTLKNELEKERI